MGRKTFQSIGRTLPGRENIVITRDKAFNQNNVFEITVETSVEQAIKHLQHEKEVFIIGGGEIYKQTINDVTTIYKTVVNSVIEGDVYFPEIDLTKFKLVWEEQHLADEKNKLDYTFQKFERL